MAEYKVGDTVRIRTGPFASFVARVEEVVPGAGKFTVVVSIFGRSTPVELAFKDVEKANPTDDPGSYRRSNN